MKKVLFLSILSVAVACGGGGKKPVAQPESDPMPTPTETVAKTGEPTAPEETKPEEPPAPPEPDPKQVAMEAELAAYETAKPVFDKFCMGCHGTGRGATKKALSELDINEYPFKGKHANATDIKKTLGVGAKKATMPKNKPGSVKGDDLAAIVAWADAWDAAEAAGAHAAGDATAPATK